MIMLDFKIHLTELCDCLMASLVNAAFYFKRDFEYLFRTVWVFGYKQSDDIEEPFWKRLSTPLLESPQDQLRKYHGIALDSKQGESFQQFLKEAEKQLEMGKPVLIEFDACYCPWAGVYHKAYLLHYSLIIGIDKEANMFLCVDPYVSGKVEQFPIDELEKGFHHHYNFLLIDPEAGTENWKEDIRQIVVDKYNSGKDMDSFNMIRVLASDIMESDRIVHEMHKQNDFYTYELFYQLKYMTHSRLNYGMFLRYIMEKESVPELEQIIEMFNEAGRLWRLIWLSFTKITYLNNSAKGAAILHNINNYILQVADIEEQCAQSLLNIIDAK